MAPTLRHRRSLLYSFPAPVRHAIPAGAGAPGQEQSVRPSAQGTSETMCAVSPAVHANAPVSLIHTMEWIGVMPILQMQKLRLWEMK